MRFNIWRDIDSYPDVHAEAAELIKFLGLEGIEGIEGGELSYGGQRLVDLGIALGSKPQVLLLDEPLAGFAAAERERGWSNLIKSVATNIPVLIVEHDIDRVLGFSQTVTVMNQGEVLMTGTPDAVRADRRVQEIYYRHRCAGGRAQKQRKRPAPALRRFCASSASTRSTAKSHILHDATLDVRDGEIDRPVGAANGAGKSTLLKTLAGLVPLASGTNRISGSQYRGAARSGYRAGAASAMCRRAAACSPGMTVRDNLSLGRLARKTDGSNGMAWSEDRILHYFPMLKERMNVAADYLSGGEQQMVAVARAMSGNVKLLLLDEPFEGLAPRRDPRIVQGVRPASAACFHRHRRA